MELVLLADLQNSFSSDWIRVANTSGLKDIHIGDRFREQGFGAGAEELEVDGLGISEVGGLSRLHVIRGANATKPEVHRLGAVFEQVGIKVDIVASKFTPPLPEESSLGWSGLNSSEAVAVTNQPTNSTIATEVPVKRGRGRPKGSRNKKAEEVALPVGFA